MRFLVTGADGFMGSHLVEALLAWRDCEHVVAMVHGPETRNLPPGGTPRLTVISADVQREGALERCPEVDAILHLAAISSANRAANRPELTRLVNFQGTVNLLNRALRMGSPPVFVYLSTAALYGEPRYLPIDEEHPIESRDPYTSSKLSSEITVVAYHREQGLPAVIVRPFNVYGPRQGEDFVVPTIITQCLQGVQLILGDGRPIRNFTYVTDAVDFLRRAATAPDARGRVLNLGTRQGHSISQIADMVVDMTGCDLTPVYDVGKFREDDPTVLEMDPSLAETVLGWRPRTSMGEGLRITIEHFRASMEAGQAQSAEDLYGQR